MMVTTMPEPKRNPICRAVGMLTVLAVLAWTSVRCKSNSNPDENLTANVVVNNSCGKTVDAYMDGALQFKVESGASSTISAVPAGSHVFEAKVTETTMLVRSETIDVVLGFDFVFAVYGPSTITVANRYGEILKISMDGTYVGDIGPDLTQTLRRIKFGEHKMEAAKRSDGTTVAKATFDVSEVKDYLWVITK